MQHPITRAEHGNTPTPEVPVGDARDRERAILLDRDSREQICVCRFLARREHRSRGADRERRSAKLGSAKCRPLLAHPLNMLLKHDIC